MDKSNWSDAVMGEKYWRMSCYIGYGPRFFVWQRISQKCDLRVTQSRCYTGTMVRTERQSLCRLLGLQEFKAPRFLDIRHMKNVSPIHRPPLHPRKYSWYSCALEAESTPGPWCGRKDYDNEIFQWHHQESNLRAFRAVHQPTACSACDGQNVYLSRITFEPVEPILAAPHLSLFTTS